MIAVRQPYYITRRPVYRAARTEAERVYRLPIDAYITDDDLVLIASVPGLKVDDLQITLDDDELVIRGEVNGAAEDVEYLLRERFYSKFERRLRLNVPVDASKAEATYEQGVLRLVLPKAEEARPRRITVNSVH